MLKQKTGHKPTQTIKGTLHTMNETQKSKTIPATRRGSLWGYEMSRIPLCVDSRPIDGDYHKIF
jgi:hypothetical protein